LEGIVHRVGLRAVTVTAQAILTGKVKAPRSAEGFLAAVRGAKVQANKKS